MVRYSDARFQIINHLTVEYFLKYRYIYSHDPNTGLSGFRMVIFRTIFGSGFWTAWYLDTRFYEVSGSQMVLGWTILLLLRIFFLWHFSIIKRSRLVDHSKTGQKCPVFIMISQIPDRSQTGQIGPVFRCGSKTEPFDNWTQVEHPNTGLVRYSDHYCIMVFPIGKKWFGPVYPNLECSVLNPRYLLNQWCNFQNFNWSDIVQFWILAVFNILAVFSILKSPILFKWSLYCFTLIEYVIWFTKYILESYWIDYN
jgi:hypothetical protein